MVSPFTQRLFCTARYLLDLREKKFPPGPGFEPGSPALRAGALMN